MTNTNKKEDCAELIYNMIKDKDNNESINTYTCCFCGKTFNGYGNNPWPLMEYPNRCCDACNAMVVIPARIERGTIG